MKHDFSAKVLMVIGVAFFTVGLLLVLRESIVFGFISQLFANATTAIIFGTLILFLGQAVFISGMMKLNSAKLISSLETERQVIANILVKNMEQLQTRMQSERQIIMANYGQATTKLGNVTADQKESSIIPSSTLLMDCKFCGAKVKPGSFCPTCGRAN